MKKEPKAPARQIDLEEMIQDVQSRTRAGKLKRQDTVKIRVSGIFKRVLDKSCVLEDESASDLLQMALAFYIEDYITPGTIRKHFTPEEQALIRGRFRRENWDI